MAYVEDDIDRLGANLGSFNVLSADRLTGRVLARVDEYLPTINDKVISPSVLWSILKSAGGGGLYPTVAQFDTIIVSNLEILSTVLDTPVGGTGHSYYNVGDLLVGNGDSKLSQLPLGNDGQLLVADSTQPLGMAWTTIEIERLTFADNEAMDHGGYNRLIVSPEQFVYGITHAKEMAAKVATFGDLEVTGKVAGIFVQNDEDVYDTTIFDKALSPYHLDILFSSPSSIGDAKANTGAFTSLNCEFLHVDNPPWPTFSFTFASDEEAAHKGESEKALVPSNLPAIMLDPGPIGTPATNYDAFFDKVVCNGLTVVGEVPWPTLDIAFATDQEAAEKQVGNKALSPANLYAALASPPEIGYDDPQPGQFTALKCSTLEITGTPPWPTLQSIYADQDDVLQPNIADKGLTPASIPVFMASPGPIGISQANDASFVNVDCSTLSVTSPLASASGGTGYGTYSAGDILIGTGAGVLAKLTPGLDNQVLLSDSTSALGVKWSSLGGNVPSATTAAYGTVKLATSKSVDDYFNSVNKESNGILALTVGNIDHLLGKGTAYGNPTASAIFNELDLSGELRTGSPLRSAYGGTGMTIYDDGAILMGNNFGGLGVLMPGAEKNVLRVLNGVPTWTAHENVTEATTTDAGTVMLASDFDIITKTNDAKAVTPKGLLTLMKNPGDIGGSQAGNATFSELTVKSVINMPATFQVSPTNGGTGLSGYAPGDILYGNANAGLTKLPIGSYGQALMVSHNNTLEWSNTGGEQVATISQSGVVQLASDAEAVDMQETDKALTPSNLPSVFTSPPIIGNETTPNKAYFSDLTVTGNLTLVNTKLGTNVGGTGVYTYTKGDILVAQDNSTLTTLHAGSEHEILRAAPSEPLGIMWDEHPFPHLYQEMSPPIMETSPYTVSIQYCYARNMYNTKNIKINTQRILDIRTIGITNNGITGGPTQSSVLPGTVSVNSNIVTGVGTSFLTDFIENGIITVSGGGGRRVATIVSNTELTVNSPFDANVTNRNYYRGGHAPHTTYYVYAANNGSVQGFFLSPRSIAINGDLPVDMPLGITKYDIRQTRYILITQSDGTLYKMHWNFNRADILPYVQLDTSAIVDTPTEFDMRFMPVTTTVVYLRARLTTSNPTGATFFVSDTSGGQYNSIAMCTNPVTDTESFAISIRGSMSFMCYLSTTENTTLGLELIGAAGIHTHDSLLDLEEQ